MSAALRRRMDAVHGKLIPKPRNRIVVAYTPLPDDPPEAWERFHEAMQTPAETRIIVEYEEEFIP